MSAAARLTEVRFGYGAGAFGLEVGALTLAAGERVACVGPSGSGKTTLLGLVAGILVPSAGVVELGGRRLDDRPDRERPSLHWVSQTIGPGRGLDVLAAALHRVETPVALHLRGRPVPGIESELRCQLPPRHTLHLHDLVPPSELTSRIAEHDIGLALEAYAPPSRNLTVTNKILHYLLGGLAVVATDTAGQQEVAAASGEAVQLCQSGDAVSLAQAIDAFATDPKALKAAQQAALDAARAAFCWEAQVPTLLSSVEDALAGTPGGSQRRITAPSEPGA